MICVNLSPDGYVMQSDAQTCSYVLITADEYSSFSDISHWFQFDASEVGIAFGAGIVLWALGLKVGAIARVIIGVKR